MREPCHEQLLTRSGAHRVRAASLALALCSGLLALRLPAQEVLTLRKALELAGKGSLSAVTSRSDEAVAREQTLQVRGTAYYPEITLQGGYTDQRDPSVSRFGLLQAPLNQKSYWQYDFTVRQLLWDFGRRSEALKSSRTREQAVRLAGSDSVRRAQAQVVERYMSAMTVRAEKEVVAKREKALSDHLRIVQDLYQQGMVARNDLLRTEVALRSVEDSARRLDDAYDTAIEALNVAIGLPTDTKETLPGDFAPPPALPWTLEHARSISVSNNGTVKALRARYQALEEQLVSRRRDYYPNLVAQYDNAYQQNEYLVYPHMQSLFVGLSWNIFDGGVRAAKIRESQADLERAHRELTEAERTAQLAASQAYRDFLEALRERKTAELNVQSSKENFRIVEDQYKAGLARTTDVLDAESVLAQSRSDLVQKTYQAYTKQAALLAAMGEDLPGFYSRQGEPVAAEEK